MRLFRKLGKTHGVAEFSHSPVKGLVRSPFQVEGSGRGDSLPLQLSTGSKLRSRRFATLGCWSAVCILAATLVTAAFAQQAGPFNPVSIGPSGASQKAGVAPLHAAAANNLVLLAQPGNVYGAYAVNATATAGSVILYNAVSAPGTGALTASLVLACTPLPANGVGSLQWSGVPPAFMSVGAVVLVSSGNCDTYTTGVITADIFGSAV